jgi:outer membrane protein OmpA-like peptidoglycan-associated protein
MTCGLLSPAVSAQRPEIQPFPGQELTQAPKIIEFDEFELVEGPIDKSRKPTKTRHLEGKISAFTYDNPKGHVSLEIYRNYEEAVKQAGFETIYACRATECGNTIYPDYLGKICEYPGCFYLAAKLARPDGDVYLALRVVNEQHAGTGMVFIEAKAMQTGQVKLTAGQMAQDLTRQGHTSVYGVYFDTGKADIKSGSEPILSEMVQLLKQDTSLKLHVVGHTDNVGGLAMNMDLSKRRADAVVRELTAKYGMDPERLRADGVGPLAPVASNQSEDGRVKNRRVELVQQ